MNDFDESDALERTAGDRNLLGEVIRFTLEDIPALLTELEINLRDEKWHEASRLAHKIKGSAGACGAQRLFLAALDLELAARDSNSSCLNYHRPMIEAFDTFRIHPDVLQLSSLDDEG